MTLKFLEEFKRSLAGLEMLPPIGPRQYLWETDSMFAKKVAIFNKYGCPSAEYAEVCRQSRQYKHDKWLYEQVKWSLTKAQHDLPR